ncbi:MAG: septation protein A [Nevskia sp.]
MEYCLMPLSETAGYTSSILEASEFDTAFMTAFIDLIPAVLFFAAYAWAGLYPATAVLMAAMAAMLVFTWLRTRRLPKLQLAITAVVLLLGGLTLWLRNPDFIKFKPTAIYGAFALALLASQFIGDRVLLSRMPQKVVVMPEPVWRKVNLAWVAFFAFCAVLNLYVAANYSEATWVKVKSFGFTTLMFAFLLLHAPFLSRYLVEEKVGPDAR